MHEAGEPTEQATPQQQAPLALHGLGEQDVPIPWKTAPGTPEQLELVSSEQNPLLAQQAPVLGHVTLEQTEPAPRQVVPGMPQLACVSTLQKPVDVKQHAPVGCGQGLGEHVEPIPCSVPPAPAHWNAS